jgi:hypothetical protein
VIADFAKVDIRRWQYKSVNIGAEKSPGATHLANEWTETEQEELAGDAVAQIPCEKERERVRERERGREGERERGRERGRKREREGAGGRER